MTCTFNVNKLVLLFCLLLPFESCLEPISPELKESDSAPTLSDEKRVCWGTKPSNSIIVQIAVIMVQMLNPIFGNKKLCY
jgi:hypothetical protein